MIIRNLTQLHENGLIKVEAEVLWEESDKDPILFCAMHDPLNFHAQELSLDR